MKPSLPSPFSILFRRVFSATALSLLEPLLDEDVPLVGVPGHHDVLCGVPLEDRPLGDLSLARRHVLFRVGDAGGHPQHHGRIESLAHRERLFHELAGLRGTGRLEHRHLRIQGHPPRVLLVLRGVHAGIVTNHNDKSRQDAGVGGRHQRVHRDVESDVLAGEQAADPADRGPQSHFESHLFVDRPLGINLRESRQDLEDVGGRGARVGARHAQAGLIGPLSQRFISGKQRLITCILLSHRRLIIRRFAGGFKENPPANRLTSSGYRTHWVRRHTRR